MVVREYPLCHSLLDPVVREGTLLRSYGQHCESRTGVERAMTDRDAAPPVGIIRAAVDAGAMPEAFLEDHGLRRERQASSEPDVLTGEEEVIASENPEPEALTLPDEVVTGKQAVVLEYPLHPSLRVLAICEGIPLPTIGQDFERRTKTCRPSSTTSATATMTKTDAAVHISYRAESPPGRVRPACNKRRGYPVMAGDVWLLHVGRAPCFPSLSWLKGEEERPHLRTKNAWTNQAPFVFGTTHPGSP
ncbi:hypothetical protein MRX96_049902 [Rhipicephalus microplus]